MTFRSGASALVLPLPPGLPLGGYAVRSATPSVGNSELSVRALVVSDEDTSIVIVSFDLLYATAGLTARVRRRIRETHGIPEEHVLVCATHTHCGPRDVSDRVDRELVEDLADCAGTAVDRAIESLVAVRLVSGESGVLDIGRNRRDPGGSVRDTATILLLEEIEDERPMGNVVATVVNLACHPTILEHDTVEYSADFVGPLRRCVEQAIGGVCVFLQGFAGNTNPVFTAHRVHECRRIGARAAGPIIRELSSMLTTGRDAFVINLSKGRVLPVPLEAGSIHNGPIRARRGVVDVERASHDPAVERPGATPDAVAAERWITELMVQQHEVFNSMDVPASGSLGLEVQTMALGPELFVIAFPGEPMTKTYREIIERLAGKRVLSVGYANGAPGYLPDRDAYAESGYEVGCSFVAAGAIELLADEAVAQLAE